MAYLVLGMGLGAFVTSAAGRVTTQDPVQVSPQYYVVRFENARVRILEYRLKPGEIHPDGTRSETAGETGAVIWRDETTHAVENVGTTEARALAVELKPCAR